MSRNPVGLALAALLAVAQFACASPDDDGFSPQCYQGSLWGTDDINGYDYAEVPSGDFYALNASRTLQEAVPGDFKEPKGPYAYWRGEKDACSLSWTFRYRVVCSEQPNGATLIQAGVGERTGQVYFTLQPGAKLPKDAIADYQGYLLTQPEVRATKSTF
ncbi:hypothetical protein PWT90_06852 [Aphanocladium album]|nr:hypothetical protein PWT90_06852 [Aphanocladium album]